MTNPLGELKLTAGGNSYRLHLGMSVLADLQEEFGDRLDAILTEPAKGGQGATAMPDLRVMHSVFLAALKRYHPEADRWVVDDLIAENQNAWARLLTATAPDAPEEGGKRTGKRKAATS